MGGSVVAFIATSWPSSISTTKLGRPQVGKRPQTDAKALLEMTTAHALTHLDRSKYYLE